MFGQQELSHIYYYVGFHHSEGNCLCPIFQLSISRELISLPLSLPPSPFLFFPSSFHSSFCPPSPFPLHPSSFPLFPSLASYPSSLYSSFSFLSPFPSTLPFFSLRPFIFTFFLFIVYILIYFPVLTKMNYLI